MTDLSCSEYLELIASSPEVLPEFLGSIEDGLSDITSSVALLRVSNDEEAINSLFRGLHTLKGNCEMVFLHAFVAMTHRLEDIVGDIRAGRSCYDPAVGDFISSACAEVEYQIRNLGNGVAIPQEQYELCLSLITQVCDASDAKRSIVALHALHELDGDVLSPITPEIAEQDSAVTTLTDIEYMSQGEIPPSWCERGSLGFLKFLSLQRDGLISPWAGRSEQELEFCHALNELLDCPVEPSQLTAAVYMHDVGMAFVPHAVVDKESALDAAEYEAVKSHVFSGAQLLKNLGGWDIAAEIVMQHHERFDGSGYPRCLKGAQIHPGAVFIGLADTFGALTSTRMGRGSQKSLLGAMSEINAAADEMFAQAYVDIFNEVVKESYDKH